MIRRKIPNVIFACQQRGAASVEFYVVSFFVFIPLVMAILQLGLFFVAKNTVNLATFSAARAGAATGGDTAAMKSAFAKAVAPLYVGTGLKALGNNGFTDLSASNYVPVMGAAYLTAFAKASLPTDSISKLNPTRNSFSDFGIANPRGAGRIIPVTNVQIDSRIGSASKQTRAEALLLKVEVKHCYDMVIPLIDSIVGKALLIMNGPANALCYVHPSIPGAPGSGRSTTYGVPIISQAVVRMTVSPLQSNFP